MLPLPPSFEMTAVVVFFFRPGVVPVTLTLNMQDAPPARVPPVSATLLVGLPVAVVDRANVLHHAADQQQTGLPLLLQQVWLQQAAGLASVHGDPLGVQAPPQQIGLPLLLQQVWLQQAPGLASVHGEPFVIQQPSQQIGLPY